MNKMKSRIAFFGLTVLVLIILGVAVGSVK